MKSLAVIEIKTIAKGFYLADLVLKLDSVELILAQPMCPGKFVLIIGGQVASVTHACEFVQAGYSQDVIDISEFGRISEQVYQGLLGINDVENKDAVGIVETFSIASLIEAADTAVKSTAVEVVELRIARGMGGKSYVLLTGTTSDVTMAVDNAKQKAAQMGLLVDAQVIASPHGELWQYFN